MVIDVLYTTPPFCNLTTPNPPTSIAILILIPLLLPFFFSSPSSLLFSFSSSLPFSDVPPEVSSLGPPFSRCHFRELHHALGSSIELVSLERKPVQFMTVSTRKRKRNENKKERKKPDAIQGQSRWSTCGSSTLLAGGVALWWMINCWID